MTQHKPTILLFLLLAISAGDSIAGLAFRNTFLSQTDSYMAAKPPVLPSTSIPIRSHYTGIVALDEHLTKLVLVFWETAWGNVPALSLLAVYMAGQCLATHTIVVLEGLRAGNKGRIVSFSSGWGMVYQTIPWGLVKPIYWSIWLFTSPLARIDVSDGPAKTIALVNTDTQQLTILPMALTIGYIIPTVLAALPAPSFWTIEQKQLLLAIWQGFPIWIGISQFVLSFVIRQRSPSTPASTIKSIRWVYRYCLALTGVTHFSVLILASFPCLFPGLFSIDACEGVSLSLVFVPQSPFSQEAAVSLADGMRTLLAYDMYYACFGTLVWAFVVTNSAKQEVLVSVLARVFIYTALYGPGGAALAMVQRRDEEVFRKVKPKGKNL